MWPLYADAGQVHQALNNLIINALQAMPDGGTLALAADNERSPPARGKPAAGRYLKITVSDEGAASRRPTCRIFDPYFTTKPDGTGLGLASAFSIVKRHGGTHRGKSQPTGGPPSPCGYRPPTARTARRATFGQGAISLPPARASGSW